MSRMPEPVFDLLALPVDEIVSRVHFDADGLVPVIAQRVDTGRVLMLAWMDEDALRATVLTRRGTYYSRSRRTQWVKGETSGHTQRVEQLHLDCDGDAIVMLVEQVGPACHTGADSCFDTGGVR